MDALVQHLYRCLGGHTQLDQMKFLCVRLRAEPSHSSHMFSVAPGCFLPASALCLSVYLWSWYLVGYTLNTGNGTHIPHLLHQVPEFGIRGMHYIFIVKNAPGRFRFRFRNCLFDIHLPSNSTSH